MYLASDLSKSNSDDEGHLQELQLLFLDQSPHSQTGANTHSSTQLILISGGVEFLLELMEGHFEIQIIIVLKCRMRALNGREKGSFLKNFMKELQYDTSIKTHANSLLVWIDSTKHLQ